MKKLLLLLLLINTLTASSAFAQSKVPPVEKYFLDSTFVMLPSAVGAVYRREVEYTDSLGGEIRDYYLSGKLQSREALENIHKQIDNGVSETWYESGQLKTHHEYLHGQSSGELRFYYPDGQLKRQENFVAGKHTTSQCYATDGKPVAFYEYRVMPVYSKGDGSAQAIVADIAQHFVYPRDALRASIEGRVFVSFDVTTKGKVTNVQVRKGIWPSVDEEAVRAVKKLGRFTPGQQDGKISKIRYTVPISLKIQ